MRLRFVLPTLAALATLAVLAPSDAPAQAKKPGPAARPIKNQVKGTGAVHEAILRRAKQGNIDLIFLGDSITYGWKLQGLGGKIFTQRYEPLKGANFGVGSDQTNNILWRITTGGELKGLTPKLIVLMVGINNITSNPKQTAAQTAEGVEAIIRVIQKNHSGTQVLLLGTFPGGKKPDHPHRKRVKALNVELAKLADGTRVRFLDISDKLLERNGAQGSAFSSDQIHLTAKGYQIWADAIQPTIDQVLGKLPSKPTPPPAPKPAPAGKRTRWVHADGELVAKGKGVWEEKFKSGKYTFVEKGTTAEHVELYDKSRDYTLRLTDTAMLIKGGKGIHPRFADFTKQRDGKWAGAGAPTPTPSTAGKLAWGKKVSPEFRVKVVAIARELGIDPSHLMACMAFESGLNPAIVNKDSGATGLIQFTTETARGLGTSTAALKKMSAVEQLDWVRKYFIGKKGKLKNIDDLYMDILFRVAVGKPDDFVLFVKDHPDKQKAKQYKQNAGLDKHPPDGKVTRGEACVPVRAKLTEGLLDKNASPLP